MQKIKLTISFLIISGGLIFLFGPEAIPENFQFQEILHEKSSADVIIIFNSGGWGNTPPEQAEDFFPIIKGIQKTLNEWGYSSIVIPYNRTKDNLLGKITGMKQVFNSFEKPSEDLAERIKFLTQSLPDKKIIVAGLSNGASFVVKTHEKVSKEVEDSVYTVAVGTPFWAKSSCSNNLLQLNNNGKDSLVEGEVNSLLSSLAKAPLKWILSRITGENIVFSQAFRLSGHDYEWSSSEVGPQIIAFLEDKFKD